ncbi:MAG: hypothetical protein ACRYE9_04410 [Janthinobacterium lividum]
MTIPQKCPIGNRCNESIKSFLDKEGYIPVKKTPKKAIKTRLCYVTKEGEKRKRLHDNLYIDLAYVARANEPDTRISLKAQILLANLAKMISRNSAGEEFIDHDFLSAITQCRSNKQNRTILGQLADIIDYKYHGCIIFQGKRRVFGYTVKFTADGEKRLKTPELFYDFVPSELVKNSLNKRKKFPPLYI